MHCARVHCTVFTPLCTWVWVIRRLAESLRHVFSLRLLRCESDKFQYLFMCMVPGTMAHELVDSYPQSKDNYPKVTEALQQRFGNPKVLKQVYVRELISMIIINKNKDKMNLASEYYKLEAHLRSLESLGVTAEQMIEFLYPMVESSLPEDTLLAWQRSSFYRRDGSKEVPPKSELDFLMAFLKQEIEHEAQRKLAREGFGDKKPENKRIQKQTEVRNDNFPQQLVCSMAQMASLSVYSVRKTTKVATASRLSQCQWT